MNQKRRQDKFLKKFDDGRSTPQEYHAAHAFGPGDKCQGCGGRPSARIIILAPMDEVQRRGMLPPGALINPKILQTVVPLKGSDGKPMPFVRLSLAYACPSCLPEAERVAAKAPSWCVVEINRGPDPTNKVQVAVS